MLLLEYPITKPLKLRRSSIFLVFLLAGLLTATVTFIGVVTVGYELVPITSTSFNSSRTFWYNKIIPRRWQPPGQICNAAIIKVAERKDYGNVTD